MKPFIKTTDYTSAASSLMMVINHFQEDFDLSRENEFLIWMNSANLPVKASSIYGLALFAKKEGLDPKVVLGEREYDFPDYRFSRYKKVDIEHAKFSSDMYFRKALKLGIPIEQRVFDFDDVERLIDDGKIVMLRVNAGVLRNSKSTSNYVVVHGKREGFMVMDPEQGELVVGRETLKEAFETLETKKKRDPKMIIF